MVHVSYSQYELDDKNSKLQRVKKKGEKKIRFCFFLLSKILQVGISLKDTDKFYHISLFVIHLLCITSVRIVTYNIIVYRDPEINFPTNTPLSNKLGHK